MDKRDLVRPLRYLLPVGGASAQEVLLHGRYGTISRLGRQSLHYGARSSDARHGFCYRNLGALANFLLTRYLVRTNVLV